MELALFELVRELFTLLVTLFFLHCCRVLYIEYVECIEYIENMNLKLEHELEHESLAAGKNVTRIQRLRL